jgi:hypothetical protein
MENVFRMSLTSLFKPLLVAAVLMSHVAAEESDPTEKCEQAYDACQEKCEQSDNASEACYEACDEAYEKCLALAQESE